MIVVSFACAMSFNRNIVECKVAKSNGGKRAINRFNRNIVECKDLRSPSRKLDRDGFNRNIVECKDRYCTVFHFYVTGF